MVMTGGWFMMFMALFYPHYSIFKGTQHFSVQAARQVIFAVVLILEVVLRCVDAAGCRFGLTKNDKNMAGENKQCLPVRLCQVYDFW